MIEMNALTWKRIAITAGKRIAIGACLLAAMAAGGAGCARKGGSGEGDVKPSARAEARGPATREDAGAERHAPADIAPGSHEDWCDEHGVPESLCTRCNASLIPAFKATGDWCEEHGLPESQCLACNPDLKIERPPKSEGS
jgi:hypothetical protein